MSTSIHNLFRHAIIFGTAILLLANTSCVLSKDSLYGTYGAVTDFSRDLYTMSGKKKTILYKNGRIETLSFMPQHRFIKKVEFTSERVEDKTMKGQWRKLNAKIIEVSFSQKVPVEYYKQVSKNKIIRLDNNQKELNSLYAPYFTFERKSEKMHFTVHHKK